MNHWNPVRVILWVLTGAAVAFTILVSVDALAAEDASAKTLLENFATAQKKKDEGAMAVAARMAPQIHNASEERPVRAKIVAALGKVAKNKKAGLAPRVAAVEALGQLDDAKAAFKHLKPLFPKPKAQPEDSLPRAVIAATGNLQADAGIPLLAGVVKKSKASALQHAAIKALGRFGASKRRQDAAKVLLEALAGWKKAAGKKSKKDEEASAGPWETLAPLAAAALRQLTGVTHESADEWLSALAAVKGKVASLFPPDAR